MASATTKTLAIKTPSASTATVTSSSSRSQSKQLELTDAASESIESTLRLQLFRSLTRIERHLRRRDPQTLSRIREWYSGGAQGVDESPDGRRGAGKGGGRKQRRYRRRRLNFASGPKRMEQHEIDNTLLAYLEIPDGVAKRSLLVLPQPDWVFSDFLPAPLVNEPAVASFQWLPDSNVSNANDSSRRSMERELMRQQLDNWAFLYFRTLRRNWESTLVEEKKATPDVNMYAEENIRKWTNKLRFKIMRQVPLKVALIAFMSRMGLESNPSVVFCRDGFYGLMDVGNAFGDLGKTPSIMIGFNASARYLGLKNGDSIYVKACSVTQRQMMEDAPRQDTPDKKYRHTVLSMEEIGEEGEYDYDLGTSDNDSDDRQIAL